MVFEAAHFNRVLNTPSATDWIPSRFEDSRLEVRVGIFFVADLRVKKTLLIFGREQNGDKKYDDPSYSISRKRSALRKICESARLHDYCI